jgi:hypothetical protein
MDSLDWVSRNLEFISPKLFDSFLNFSHEIYETHKSTFSKNSFFSEDHNSSVMKSLRRLVLETQDKGASDGVKRQLPQYLQLLEVSLMSKFNLKKGVKLEIHHVVVNIILSTDTTEVSRLQAQICFSRMLSYENIIHDMIEKPYFAHWMSTCLDNLPADVTLYSSAFKILRNAF